MNPDTLVRMANRIGTFFEAMPDRPQAVRDVASHIARSWEPRMLRALQQRIGTDGCDGLSAIVQEAVRDHLPPAGAARRENAA